MSAGSVSPDFDTRVRCLGLRAVSCLRSNVDALAPFLVELFNQSLLQSIVPTIFKSAYITPLLIEPNLDPAENKSYRPMSNLSVIMLLKRLEARQLLDYLYAANLMPDLQSAYGPII